MKVIGEGFILSRAGRDEFAVAADEHFGRIVRPYLNGRDLSQRSRDVFVIDFFGHDEPWVQANYPALYSHLLSSVKPAREQSRNEKFAREWWVIGHPRPLFRKFSLGLHRYIATLETAKHRFFVYLSTDTVPDSALVTFGLDDGFHLGVLSSRIHVAWTIATGGTLEDRPRYNKSRCFDPFPFPDTSDEALKDRIRHAAEKLDALRKDVLARHEDLTLTQLYNVLEALRAAEEAGTVLSDKDRDVATRGCVSLIRQYHDTIDAAVAEAYGWPADLSDEEILERLVALNKQRAAEEARGEVRWLRPEFQKPGYAAPTEQKTLALSEVAQTGAVILEWPTALPEQFTAVAGVVDRAAKPIAANDVARAFRGKNAKSVSPVLDTLAGMGRLRKLEDGRYVA